MKSEDTSVSQPLVSVIVVTYNSAKFIIETLESVRNQTYKNTQLVISDDCSQDTTLTLCNNWLRENKENFSSSDLISSEKNLGIPSNCNAGLAAAKGVWVKFLAGDDILDPRAIESFIDYASSHEDVCLVESKSRFFLRFFSPDNFTHVQDLSNTGFFDQSTSASEQYQALLRRNYIHAPGTFILKEALVNVGGFDERYRLIEDHPLWLRLTFSGYRFHFLDLVTVYYRLHESSVFASKSKGSIFNGFYRHRRAFDRDYILPNLSIIERWACNYDYYRLLLIDKLGLNRNYRLLRLIFRLTDVKDLVRKSRRVGSGSR